MNWLKVKNDILESKLKKIIGNNEGIKDIASGKVYPGWISTRVDSRANTLIYMKSILKKRK